MKRLASIAAGFALGCVLLSGGSIGASMRAQASPQSGPQTPANGGSQLTPAAEAPGANRRETDENEAYRHSLMVQKLGSMFGMRTETAATVFEVANFAILALLVGGFLARVLPKTFRARTGVIESQLVEARTATEAAGARLAKVEDRLAHLDGQIAEMRMQAERDGAAEDERMRTAVANEAAKLLAAADAEIAAATLEARRQLQRYAAELAIDGAGRRLQVTPETDRLLVQGFTARLRSRELPDSSPDSSRGVN